MRRPKVLAASFAFALLAEPAAAPRSAAAVAPDATVQSAPGTRRGVIRYRLRGATAVTGGIMSSAVAGTLGGATIVSRSMNALGKILGGGAGHLTDKASPGDLAKLGRGGSQMPDLNDLISRIPINAEYAADVSFVLRETGDGVFELQSGSIHWSASTDAEVKLTGDGNTHHFKDQFRGEGTAKLDPRSSTIRIAPAELADGSEGDVDVDIGITHEMIVNGTSMWSAMNGLQVITMNSQGGIRSSQLQFLGQTWPAEKTPDPIGGGFAYGRRMPEDSLYQYQEIFQDLMDAGEVIQWEIYDECGATIASPEERDKLTYDLGTPGKITRQARADVTPAFWDSDLRWEFHPITGSDLDPIIENANGNDFPVTYTGLPEKNSTFAWYPVKARFDPEGARPVRCKNPAPREVGYFFSTKGTNHPGPDDKAPRNTEKTPDPNWFYYWRQTKAAHGKAPLIKYGGHVAPCARTPGAKLPNGKADSNHSANAYWTPGAKFVVVCDIALQGFTNGWPPLIVGPSFQGIDMFAGIVRHELTHKANGEAWWRKTDAASMARDRARDNWWLNRQRALDTDGDDIPDHIEENLPVPPQIRTNLTRFNKHLPNSFGQKMIDEEYVAYAAEATWPQHSVKTEDWACPGQQTDDAPCR